MDRNVSLLIQSTVLVFAWRDWGKPLKFSVRIVDVPVRFQYLDHKSEALPFETPCSVRECIKVRFVYIINETNESSRPIIPLCCLLLVHSPCQTDEVLLHKCISRPDTERHRMLILNCALCYFQSSLLSVYWTLTMLTLACSLFRLCACQLHRKLLEQQPFSHLEKLNIVTYFGYNYFTCTQYSWQRRIAFVCLLWIPFLKTKLRVRYLKKYNRMKGFCSALAPIFLWVSLRL